MQARADFVQLVLVFDLNAEVIETGDPAARRNRKIDARIVQHPFGVIRFDNGRFGREQRRVEADARPQIVNRDMDMHAFHGSVSPQIVGRR